MTIFPIPPFQKGAESTEPPDLTITCPPGFGLKKPEKICGKCINNIADERTLVFYVYYSHNCVSISTCIKLNVKKKTTFK